MIPNAVNAALPQVDMERVLKMFQKVDPQSALHRRCREVLGARMETKGIPQPTPRRGRKFLTIGMSTFDDYDGCYFSIQAIRLYHPEILDDVEFLVIDNNPTGRPAQALKSLESWAPNYRYIPYCGSQGTAVRDLLFREASGDFVLCMDCHVLFPPGALAKLIQYFRENPSTKDLLQGPLISDSMEPMATHFDPKWSQGMYGCWGMDDRGKDPGGEPFEIGMHGAGVYACRRDAWPGFNPRLAGFGGEEGYIHEKIRRAGGRNLCLPFLRWMHRFERPMGIPYQPSWTDRVRNYMLIYDELGLDPKPVIDHFEELLGKEAAQSMIEAARLEIASPFHFFDAIYCINLDSEPDRWYEMQLRFHKLAIARRVRRLSATESPVNHHIGCALSHRRIIAEAKAQGLRSVLVFEDDARFTSDAADVLALSLRELEGRDWQLLYLGGYGWEAGYQRIPGCEHLVLPGHLTCTHAIAYHHSVYDAILDGVPESAVDVAAWTQKHAAIDQFYTFSLNAATYLTYPIIATQGSILSQEKRVFED